MTRRPRFAILLWVLPIVLAVAVLGSGFLGEGPLPFGRAQPPAGVTLTDLHDIGDLQTTFNHDAGKPRLILLVSPT